MNPVESFTNTFENAVSQELGNLGSAAVQGVIGATTGQWEGLVAQAAGVPAGEIQSPFNSLGNLTKNFGVFMIGFLLLVIGGVWFAFSWGDDIANAAQQIADRMPIPAE